MVNIWVNINISANTNFFVDIYGVAQPKKNKISATTSKIWVAVD